uniref:Putative cell growth-regulating nucleolar protein n=1 Tax=Lutzomyia longipalpis TaxID=7200 RepID=A0A7G3ADZ6_LUTLO
MVVFTCNHCGESLKKQAVEKHYKWQKCQGAPVFLTCVDCLKDFRQDEYVGHIKCISEAERYYGKDYQAKPSQNKGQKKQEAWTDIIQSVLQRDDLSTRLRGVLHTLTKHQNVPRKKPKFLNFMKNVSKQTSEYDATRIFDLIEEAFQKAKEVSNGESSSNVKDKKTTANGHETSENGENGNEAKENGDSEDVQEHSLEDKKKNKSKTDKNENGLENIAQEVEPPKKKKKKNAPEASADDAVVGDVQEQEEKPKKKRKKQENGDAVHDESVQEAAEPKIPTDNGVTDNVQEQEEKPKKKRKKQENGDAVQDESVQEAMEPKKKRKKQQTTEDVVEENMENSEKIPEQKESPAKTKKRKEVMKSIKESDANQVSFPWMETIRKILEKAEGNISKEKLKKRLLKKHLKLYPECTKIEKTIDIVMSRRLRKIKDVSVEDGLVTLKA